jgi:hypothetical protein
VGLGDEMGNREYRATAKAHWCPDTVFERPSGVTEHRTERVDWKRIGRRDFALERFLLACL